MSEPTTDGKVILKTTLGDLEVELWSKEAPKACRNFVQLCLENYYDNCLFHRVVKNFIAQTGDPTGTGEGGVSAYDGLPFKDEFHSRLRFTRRGMLGMASAAPDSNQSQFFITLDAAESLTRKHTLFGKIVGDTLFNILKVNEIELDDDKPLFPPKIITTDVVYNPFDDITPRQKKSTQVTKQKKKIIPKNLGLLSFGDEEPQDDEISAKSTTNDSSKKVQKPEPVIKKEVTSQPSDSKSFEERMRENIKQKSINLKRDREDDINDKDKEEITEEKVNENEQSSTPLSKETTSISTTAPTTIQPKEKKKKVVGSLSFKRTVKKGDDTPIAPPRIKKQQGDSYVLHKLSNFKKSLASPTENEDWKSHKLVFNSQSANQEHYM